METGNDDRYQPTREPAFTQTGQIGLVVRDLDATLRRYVDDYGIGPWQIFEVGPENAPDLRHDGEPVKGTVRSAVAMIGSVMWEITQPLDDQGIFARFLAEKGEGVHHIALYTRDFHGLVAEQLAQGKQFPLSGSFSGIDVAYLPTDQDLGVVIEIFSGGSPDDQKPDAAENA